MPLLTVVGGCHLLPAHVTPLSQLTQCIAMQQFMLLYMESSLPDRICEVLRGSSSLVGLDIRHTSVGLDKLEPLMWWVSVAGDT